MEGMHPFFLMEGNAWLPALSHLDVNPKSCCQTRAGRDSVPCIRSQS